MAPDGELQHTQFSFRKTLLLTLSALFGLGAWISTNSIFTQLPLLIREAPEGWLLPSYLSLVVQIANIGPLLYSALKSKIKDEKSLILGSLIFSTVAMFLLSLFYTKTLIMFGNSISILLLALTFLLSLVCCSSSLLFIPFMNLFPHTYMISYMMGEGLSGFLPSLMALFQGIGGNPDCANSNVGTGNFDKTVKPNFSSGIFFGIIGLLLAISTIAFYFLTKCELGNRNLKFKDQSNNENSQTFNPMSTATSSFLLIVTVVLTAFSNGSLPTLQEYSALPYGNLAYHLSVNLANMANPVACLVLYFLLKVPWTLLISSFIISGCLAFYVTLVAIMSPSPPLQESQLGVPLIVLTWVLCSGSVTFAKVATLNKFRKNGKSALFWFGAAMQFGSSLGAISIFLLISYTSLFQVYNPCA